MKNFILIASLLSFSLFSASSKAGIIQLYAMLDGLQEVPSVVTRASGFAILTLDTVALTLDYHITLVGLDLDGTITPNNVLDDVTGLHFHNAPFGSNGSVDFGVIGLFQDLDDMVINAIAGTVSGRWEETDIASQALSLNILELIQGRFYINVHTTLYPSGEIRGQIVPEPNMLSLMLLSLVFLIKRKETLPTVLVK